MLSSPVMVTRKTLGSKKGFEMSIQGFKEPYSLYRPL